MKLFTSLTEELPRKSLIDIPEILWKCELQGMKTCYLSKYCRYLIQKASLLKRLFHTLCVTIKNWVITTLNDPLIIRGLSQKESRLNIIFDLDEVCKSLLFSQTLVSFFTKFWNYFRCILGFYGFKFSLRNDFV